MNDANFNPYSPPEAGRNFSRSATKPSVRPSYLTIALTLVAVGFSTFTVVLLTARSPDDVKAGKMFLFNVPILWSAVLMTSKPQIAFWLGLLAAGIQLTITTVMLWAGIGSPVIVLFINGVIVIPLLISAFLLLKTSRTQAEQ